MEKISREDIQLNPTVGAVLRLVIASCLSMLVSGCGLFDDRQVEFEMLFPTGSDAEVFDYQIVGENAIVNGLSIPEPSAYNDSLLRFRAHLSGFEPNLELAYKVFYRNISYARMRGDADFYGGWGYGEEDFEFVRTDEAGKLSLEGGVRIQGNPRNEEKYIGLARTNPNPSQEEILKMEKRILESPDWMQSVREKADFNGLDFESQMKKDALWMLSHTPEEGSSNNRWQRNPRMGEYEFMFVVLSREDFDGLSPAQQNITVEEKSGYVDPFQFFKEMGRSVCSNTAQQRLKLTLRMNPARGIFINRLSSESVEWSDSLMSNTCGVDSHLFAESHWEQFFHVIDRKFYLKNVPISADVVSGYTQEKYQEGMKRYPMDTRDSVHFQISDLPCETVELDNNSILLSNPPERKEHVGVKTRIGMTYGTYTLKMSFPKLLSDDGVWNGITNAFWMIFESDADWNMRSKSKSGFLTKTASQFNPGNRIEETTYSEIDIEIVKTRENWSPEDDDPNQSIGKDITVSYTNWDMCDKDVEDFILGEQNRSTREGDFVFHRWHQHYNAITCKQNFDHDEILGREYYYFQIEWKPDHITWRMGPEKDELFVFGYMDERMTNIPDNQMVSVITQEFHAEEWWPRAPFGQNNIPFPSKPLEGRILELTVE